MCRRGIFNIDGSGRFRNKNLFPDFFFPLKKERQVAICLAHFVCACIYRRSLGEGLCHAMKQRWEDGSFDRGPLVLHEESMKLRLLERFSMYLLQLVLSENLEHQWLRAESTMISQGVPI